MATRGSGDRKAPPTRPPVVRTRAELERVLAAVGDRTGTRGLVPTMGALHEGHAQLVRRAVRDNDQAVVSIFVNPLQFAPSEDFARYPRNLDADLDLLAPLAVAAVFAPDADRFVGARGRTTVHVAGLGARLEGASRPSHFDGVTTIVAKLLNVVRPDRAYFGVKDYQQLAIIRAMVADLDVPVQVVSCPVARAPDGLALSSRNAYLSPAERQDALVLSRTLHALAGTWAGDADRARQHLRATLAAAPGVRLDYAEVVDPETLEPLEGDVPGPAQALVAAYVGSTRLIDTIRLEPHGPDTGG